MPEKIATDAAGRLASDFVLPGMRRAIAANVAPRACATTASSTPTWPGYRPTRWRTSAWRRGTKEQAKNAITAKAQGIASDA